MRQLVNSIKLASGCIRCGYNKSAAALEFNHTDPSNKYTTRTGRRLHLSDMVATGYGLTTIMEEIRKCEILCANCHAELTHKCTEATHDDRKSAAGLMTELRVMN